MIAQRDENMMKAAEDLYTMNGDETIRAQCRARADYYRMQNTINQKIKQLTAENEKLTASISEKDREIALLKKQLAERTSSSGYAEDI
jgi:predicted RNase H-like nuclease (RuvC/YqgF family)